MHVPRAHQNERAFGKQLRASIYGVDGPAVRDEKQLVKIMRVNFIRRRHTALVQNARTPHRCADFLRKNAEAQRRSFRRPLSSAIITRQKNGIKKFQF